MKKQSKFFTDSEGRVRYIDNDRKAKDTGGAQVAKIETAPQRGKKGNFITKDGKVIFVGGPGGGGGGVGGGAVGGSTASVSESSRNLLGQAALIAPEVISGWQFTEPGNYVIRARTEKGERVGGTVALSNAGYTARYIFRSQQPSGYNVDKSLGIFDSPVEGMVAIQNMVKLDKIYHGQE